jgi:hypothetical protein
MCSRVACKVNNDVLCFALFISTLCTFICVLHSTLKPFPLYLCFAISFALFTIFCVILIFALHFFDICSMFHLFKVIMFTSSSWQWCFALYTFHFHYMCVSIRALCFSFQLLFSFSSFVMWFASFIVISLIIFMFFVASSVWFQLLIFSF